MSTKGLGGALGVSPTAKGTGRPFSWPCLQRFIYSRSQSTENHCPQSKRLLFQNTSTIASSVSAGALASGVFGAAAGDSFEGCKQISAAAVSRDTIQRCRTHAVNSESQPNRRQSTRKWRKKTHRNSLQVVFVFVLGKILYSSHLSLLAQTHKKHENSSLSFRLVWCRFCFLAASATPTTTAHSLPLRFFVPAPILLLLLASSR